MLQIKPIRNLIAKGLRASTGYIAITAESGGDKPAYPYTALKFTTLGDTIGQGAQYMKGTQQVNEEDVEMVLSLTCYSDTLDSASDLAYAVLAYFKVHGVQVLQDAHIAIVEIGDITDRTTFLTTNWEHRAGFDVRLRVRTQIMTTAEYIETVNINRN